MIEDLVRRAQQEPRDRAALEKIYRLLMPKIESAVKGAGVVPRSDVFETAHGIAIRLLEGMNQLRDPRKFWPWAMAGTRNAIRNIIRSKAGKNKVTWANFEAQEEVGGIALDHALAELNADLHACVEKLPRQQHEVIYLRYWQEMSFPEIGRKLGIQDGTARATWSQALDNLRECPGIPLNGGGD